MPRLLRHALVCVLICLVALPHGEAHAAGTPAVGHAGAEADPGAGPKIEPVPRMALPEGEPVDVPRGPSLAAEPVETP
ncbi:hypothetical protein N5079_19185 [Planotetraspora sp. A-T 1434]|uniref:hypothetical protein n=1 Tax=Planotetraspora sp. A-T 1434 TaxID=2979219 RepID=UPI0021C12A5A|nr:hypothetical protein [Planotetraspora sp. A-T 1434]MCT9932330.1 hypothetical protein [Planotetraspora sp. A-T 1434]